MGRTAERPEVSFVITHFRGEKLLSNCLASVDALQTDIPHEVIVVDDRSDDGSVAAVKGLFPRVRFVSLSRNKGCAAAKNHGVAEARGHFIAFLDNDVEIGPHWLERIYHRLSREDERVGQCASHILLNGLDTHINSTGGMINLLGYAWDRGIFSPDCACYSPDSPIMFACGAANLLRREVHENLGGFDERYRYPFEDADFGWRMNAMGYRVVYEPSAIARHRLSATMGLDTNRQIYLYERNRLRSLLKNMDACTLRWMRRELPHHMWERMRLGARGRGLSTRDGLHVFLRIVQALAWNALYLPETLSQRRELQRRRKRRDWELIADGVLSAHIGNPPVEELDLRALQGEGAPRQESVPAHPPCRMRMGHDDKSLGPGWHLLECNEAGMIFRWTSQSARLHLRKPRGSRHLVIHSIMANPGEYSRVSVSLEGRKVTTFEAPNRPHAQKVLLPEGLPSGPLRVDLEVANPFVPRDALGIMDMRTLGIAVSGVEMT